MNLIIDKMTASDIKGVFAVEKTCFEDYWSEGSFRAELQNNLARYLVARLDDKIVGYIGAWFIIDEAHITNVAVHEDYRGMGIGNELVKAMIRLCREEMVHSMTLEVRKSNLIARGLYEKMGFTMGGIRKEYYQNNKEDAIIMWNNLREVNIDE